MNPERWKKIDHLLDQLLELTPERRALLLDEACGSDKDLRREVEALLSSADTQRSFMPTDGAMMAAGLLPGDNAVMSDEKIESTGESTTERSAFPLDNSLLAGRYELINRLGKGGMGEVWHAFDIKLRVHVALKAVRLEKRSTNAVEALRQEVRTAREVISPHVCRIFDLVVGQGYEMVSMEYIDGITLHEMTKQKAPLSFQEAREIGLQFLAGLEAIHKAGLVHRDFKPENVMITRTGRVVVMDLGIAKPVTQVSGTISGTPAYMSPEQLGGGKVDQRCDIFAAGIVLAEMIHPQGIKSRESREKIWIAIRMEPPQIENTAWKSIIERAVAANPDHRFNSVAELSHALKDAPDSVQPHVERKSDERPVTTAAVSTWISSLHLSKRARMTLASLMLIIGLGVGLFTLKNPLSNGSKRAFLPEQKYLAVLPFINVGGIKANQAFCDGLVETLASRLTELEQFHGTLWVVPTSELRRLETGSVAQARKNFAVTLAITGSVQREEDNIRLTANLIDARTLRQLRAITIDTTIQDPILQDDLISQITEMMQLEMDPKARNNLSAQTTNVARAYDYYLQGEGYLVRPEVIENVDTAIQLFGQARSLDPQFPPAFAGLSKAYWLKYDITKDEKWVALAERNCKHGLQLNSNLAPLHVMLGVIENGTGKYEEAVLEFNRALSLDHTNFDAYLGLANSYSLMQDSAKAEATYKRAIALRPYVWSGYSWLGFFYYSSARLPEAAQMFEKVVQLVPDSFRGYSNLSAIYLLQGRYPDAIFALKKSIAIRANPEAFWNLGYTYYLVRRFAEGASMYEKAAMLEPKHYSIWGGLADCYYRLPGQGEKAKTAYEHAIEAAGAQLKLNSRDPNAIVSLAYFYAKLGNKPKSLENLNYALSLAPDSAEFAFYAALVYNQVGQTAMALDWLKRAVKREYSVSEIRNRIEFDDLHDESAFRALVAHPKS